MQTEQPDFMQAALPLYSLVTGMKRFVDSGTITRDMDFTLKILPNNQALGLLASDSALTREVEDYLGQLGLRKMRFFSSGNFALVFDTTHDQIVKLGIHKHNGDIEDDAILKPIASKVFHGAKGADLSLEIFPKVETKNATWDHVEALGIHFARKGYVLRHTEPSNVGLLPDGTPILIDAGSVARNAEKKHERENFERWKTQPEPAYEWAGKQEKYFPRIETRELQGVAGNAALAKMEEGMGEEGRVYSARIRSRRQYYGDLRDDLGRAAESTLGGGGDRKLTGHLKDEGAPSSGKLNR